MQTPELPTPEQFAALVAALAFVKKIVVAIGVFVAAALAYAVRLTYKATRMLTRFEATEETVKEIETALDDEYLTKEQFLQLQNAGCSNIKSAVDKKLNDTIFEMREEQAEIKLNLYLLLGKFGIEPVKEIRKRHHEN